MIYLKRFCFAIVIFLCVVIGVLGTLVQMVTIPIWGLIYYVITGEDPVDSEATVWTISMKIMYWYTNKFGPNGDYK